MAELTPELRAAIDVAKQRIKVDTYYPKAMNAAIKGHAQGFISGTFMGILTGAMAGGLCLAGLALAQSPLVSLGWSLVLGAAGVGAGIGNITGSRAGIAAGTSAGVAAERERRDKAEQLEQEILKSPEKQREVIEAYRKDPVVEKTDTVCETFATTRDPKKAWGQIVNLKTMAITVLLSMAAGAIVCGGAFLLATGGALTSAGTSLGWGMLTAKSLGGAALIGAGLGSSTGVALGIAYPKIFASLTKHVADLMTGKVFEGKSNFPHIKNVREIEAEAAHNRAVSEQMAPAMKVAYKAPRAADEAPADAPTHHITEAADAVRLVPIERQVSAS